MKTRLDHVRVNVTELKRAVEWYTRLLGFEVNNYWPPGKPNYVDFISLSGSTFALMEVGDLQSGGRYNFTVDDVDYLWEGLKHLVQVVEALFDTLFGARKFTILGLDGNELGIVDG